MKKKILLTGSNGMLAYDFIKLFDEVYDIVKVDREEMDITNIENIIPVVKKTNPNFILNFAAYTSVDEAEDIGMKINYDVNALGVYNLSKVCKDYDIGFITISSDYVFGGDKKDGYNESDIRSPINQYGMAKYLGEKLVFLENSSSIIVRTSRLYGGTTEYRNFVNTMINLGNKLDSIKVVNDQFGSPTNCIDLCFAIEKLIGNYDNNFGKIFHFSNETPKGGITWYDFAKEIFAQTGISVKVNHCESFEFPTKAKRPSFSKLNNNSDIKLPDWRDSLKQYLSSLK